MGVPCGFRIRFILKLLRKPLHVLFLASLTISVILSFSMLDTKEIFLVWNNDHAGVRTPAERGEDGVNNGNGIPQVSESNKQVEDIVDTILTIPASDSNETKASKDKMDKISSHLRGRLNIHRWDSICGLTVDNLRSNSFFPHQPNWRSSVNMPMIATSNTENFGQRIFGYVHPPLSGLYQFAISSDDFSELWLGSSEYSNNASLISHVGGYEKQRFVVGWTKPGEFQKYESQTSQKIYMNADEKYFIEILHKQQSGSAHVHVVWKLPGSNKFVDISKKYISAYMEQHAVFPVSDNGELTQHKTTSTKNNYLIFMNTSKARYLHKNTNKLPICSSSMTKVKNKIGRYGGLSHAHLAQVYPNDGSGDIVQFCKDNRLSRECYGNRLLKKEEASRIIDLYLKSARLKDYAFKSVIKVEKFLSSSSKIHHFFIDIEVMNKKSKDVSRITEAVWENTANMKICSPVNNSWHPDVTVYLIITVKNQGVWLRHFVDNIAYIQEKTNDSAIHPIIVDFGSDDVGPNDTEVYLARSQIKNYTVIHKNGDFYKTAAINTAAASVKDNNSILFQLDLHLDLPVNIIDTVRKHTIQGKLAFAPILMRLSCGSSPNSFRFGHWEDEGYGLFAIYKSDWIRFGGMNEKEFKNRWGGEDWEMLDRVIMSNIAVQNMKIPGLFHYHHSKEQLWNNIV